MMARRKLIAGWVAAACFGTAIGLMINMLLP